MFNVITLVIDLADGTKTPLARGSAMLAPSVQLTDIPDQFIAAAAPVQVPFGTGSPPSFPQAAGLAATDNTGPLPSGWGWGISFPGVPGSPAPFTFFLPAGPCSFTASNASPCVFTWTPTPAFTAASLVPLPNGTGVQLSGGPLPAGFTAGTTYYAVGSSGSTFQLAAAPGGPPLASTGAGSGNFTAVQYRLSALTPVSSVTAMQAYMPLPSGAPQAGQVPIATGAAGASAWGNVAVNPMTALGDTLYGGTGGALARLAGNTAVTRKFLGQAGTGTASAAPAWNTIGAGDLPLASLGVYDIVNYGAACDGVTDDAAAWNSAISAAQSAGGGIVFHPGGTSVVSGYPQVTGSNIIIRGTGPKSVILLAPSSMTASGQTIGVWVNGGSNVLIENLCIDGNFANIAKDGGTVVPSTFGGGTAQLGAAVSTAPAAGTTETWTVNAAASTASAAYSSPFAVKVDSEFVLVTGGYGTTSWTVRRGFGQGNGGGATATHSNSAGIASTHGTLFDATITAYGSGTPKTYISSAYAGGADASTYLQYRAPVRVSNAENVTVQRCLIRNSVSAGILADATAVNGCTDILAVGNRIKLTWDNGVYFHKGVQYATATENLISDTMYNSVSAVYCDHILVEANNCRQAGPSFSDSGGTQINGSSNCLVQGNIYDKCQFYGVEVLASQETNITGGAGGNQVWAYNNVIANNQVTGCHANDYPSHTANGVNIFGANKTAISGNIIRDCDQGISAGQYSVGAYIAVNRITDCKGAGSAIGGAGTSDVLDTTITGNYYAYNGGSGVYAVGPCKIFDNAFIANGWGGSAEGVQIATPPGGYGRVTHYITGNYFADNTDSHILVNGGTTPLPIIERNIFTNSPGVFCTDGVTNGTTTFTSATASFVSSDAGKVLIILDQGTGGTTTATTIASVTNGTTVVLNAAPAGTQTGLLFYVGRGPNYYGDGSTTTASNSVLTSATAAFTSSDVGLLIVLLSTDPEPAILGVTTVNGFTSSTQVTLASDFGTLAACGFFINRQQGQTGKAINNFSGNPVIERNNSFYGMPPYQGAAGVVNAVQPATQWLARRPVADHAYTLNQQDQLVAVTSLTAGRTITLPAGFGTATLPYYVDVKDESGTAAANNITLSVSGGGTIDGAASITLKENYGQVRVYSTGSNWYSMAVQGAAPAAFKPASPAGTTSTTAVMMGLGSTCAFTPKGSGRVLVNVTAYAQSATNAAGINCGGRYGTGGAPANGAAATGTQFGSAADAGAKPNGTGGNAGTAFAFTDIVPLTPGTAYWFDLALLTTNVADAASLANVSMTLVELP